MKSVVRRVNSHGGKVCFVRLHCERKELERRVNSEARKALGKIASKGALRHLVRRFDPDLDVPFRPNLTIDTTSQCPTKAARAIAQFYNLRNAKRR